MLRNCCKVESYVNLMYVYILKCDNNSYYIGIAANMEHRLKQHIGILKGGAKYTRIHKVTAVMAIWEDKSGDYARKLEFQLKKKLSHNDKKQLIENPNMPFSSFGIDIQNQKFNYINPKELNDTFGFKY